MSLIEKLEKKRVLLLDMNQAQAEKSRNFLIVNGAKQVLIANDFKEAYEYFKNDAIDYCICDYRIINIKAQLFIKKLRKDKLLDDDNMLILLSDFEDEVERLSDTKKSSTLGGSNVNKEKKEEFDFYKIYNDQLSHKIDEIFEDYCHTRALMLVRTTSQEVPAKIIEVSPERLSLVLSTNSLEKAENYARQIKFITENEGNKKSQTIIGDLTLIEDMDQTQNEFELVVPSEYKENLLEIEKELSKAQEKTRKLLEVMKGS